MEKRWAQSPGPREQLALFRESLDDVVAAGHPVRLLDSCLDLVDWGPWEARYAGHRGQPPIRPKLMAGCILYGLMRGMRSSRALEEATRERVDFMWFLERRTIDHATFAAFRVTFGEELKGLHRTIGRLICERYADALLTLVLDGTRLRANSDRYGARTAERLGRLVAACVAALDEKLSHLAQEDERTEADAAELGRLRAEIERLEAQIAQYERALAVARDRDARKQAIQGSGSQAVRVPVTDPDAWIVPNKEGGYAPNYTPTVAVDAASRAIISAQVLEGSDESTAVLPAVEAAQSLGGVTPHRVLADTGLASGPVLAGLEAQSIEAYMPTATDFSERNPANRPDPTQPVPESQWAQLPQRDGRLATAAFLYDAQGDLYRCPMGQPLRRVRGGKYHRTGIAYTQYLCPGRAGCPLAAQCVKGKAAARMVVRDEYQHVRDTVGRRMATPGGREVYRARAPVVEGTFAAIKHVLGVRRFLLRGLEKVRTEWNWICTAFNLRRLLRLLRPSAPAKSAPRDTPATRGSRPSGCGNAEIRPTTPNSPLLPPYGVTYAMARVSRSDCGQAPLRPRTRYYASPNGSVQ